MKQYVAFLRAINVAGHATVKMAALQDAFAAAGCLDVKTFIQSGNVLFSAPEEDRQAILQAILAKLRELLGREAGVMFRTVRELERIVEAAPFQAFEAEPEIKRYVTFLSQRPRKKPIFLWVSAKEALEAIAMNPLEVFVVSRRKANGFYGFPNEFMEKELGVSATSRNWTTVTKIVGFVAKNGHKPA